MIYQLAKTNVVLGGQLEWRFILGYRNGELVVKDLHIAPISRNIIYNNFVSENALNYPHRDNILKLYKKIAGEFFLKKTTPILKTDYPIHVDDVTKSPQTATMEQQYEMGARRENVGLYGKQFSFFCPFWMDSIKDFTENGLRFVFCMTRPDTEIINPEDPEEEPHQYTHGSTEDLLSPNNDGIKMVLRISEGCNTKIYNYIKEYIEAINLNTDLININLSERTATVSGIDCESGDVVTKGVNNIITDLQYRERPMLEQMNMIMKLFSDNHIICKQLFNFRFFFDVDDLILDESARKSLINAPMIYSVFMSNASDFDVRMKCSNIKLYDFLTNFDFLGKKRIDIDDVIEGKYRTSMATPHGNYNTNALDYLRDYECIDIIHENKINQQTCYWRLYDNPDQIFNFYKGLNYDVYKANTDSPPVKELVGNNDGMFDATPIMSTTSSSPGMFANNWVNFYDCVGNDPLISSLTNLANGEIKMNNDVWFTQYVKPYYSKFVINKDTKVFWMNLIKYDVTDSNNFAEKIGEFNDDVVIYMINILYNKSGRFGCTIKDYVEDNKHNFIIINIGGYDDLVDPPVNTSECLSLNYFISHADELFPVGSPETDEVRELMIALSKTVVRPTKVTINKSLNYKTVEGPTVDVTEFKYVKRNDFCVQLYRYGGNLYPMFIPTRLEDGADKIYYNFRYWVKQYTDYYGSELGRVFIDNLPSKYKPTYPSIGYDSLNKEDDRINYYDYDAKMADSNRSTNETYDYVPEYQWYEASMLRKLKPSITITEQDGAINNEDILLEDFCIQMYGEEPNENLKNFVRQYIIKLYNKKITLESIPEKDGNEIKIVNNYTIIYTLK